jgi:uncharacterized protein YebE (UPF0316 family)
LPIISQTVLFIFMFKTLDCVFSTLKSIFLYKGQHFASSMCGTFAVVMYTISLLYTFNSNDAAGLFAIGIATFIGSYLPAKFMEKLEKDQLWVYEITSDTLETGKSFADELREINIPVSTTAVRDKNLNKVLLCKAYSQSKTDSRCIESLIPGAFKFSIISSAIAKES